MKKNYKSRIVLLLLNIVIIIPMFIYDKYFCFSGKYKNKCFLLEYKDIFMEPLFYFISSVLVVSIVLFFVRYMVFEKWVKLAMVMSVIVWYFILITPVSVYSFSPLTIEREIVSIWMSSLFLIISIVMIIIWSLKEEKKNK